LYEAEWAVISNTGALTPFTRDKLLLSLYESCKHRKSALSDAGALTDTIIKKLLPHAQHGRVSRTLIIQTAQVALNRFDTAASTHYTAYHQS
jgi:transcriptional regulator NrdR family protein